VIVALIFSYCVVALLVLIWVVFIRRLGPINVVEGYLDVSWIVHRITLVAL